ncbi:MAG TPA: extradiol dioxygenase [Candidatus Kapabacteria bacterium]|jgi:hypothetical protein|nr:extradiol dioxygenase [Candidatus Kapabacteria bacterium]
MIVGVHALLYSTNADLDRAFLRDVLGFSNIDAGDGWLIFKLPPAELGVHPADGEEHSELYLLCDDIASTIVDLRAKSVECSEPSDQGWGVLSMITLPSGGKLGVYEPRHPLAIKL